MAIPMQTFVHAPCITPDMMDNALPDHVFPVHALLARVLRSPIALRPTLRTTENPDVLVSWAVTNATLHCGYLLHQMQQNWH